MHKLGKYLIKLILKNSFWVILITCLITLGALLCIPRIRFDNSVDAFFNKKSKSYIDFKEWKAEFGSDDLIVIAFSDQEIFTAENLNLISLLTQKFESLQYVDKVTSLTNVTDIIGSESDFFVEPLVNKIPTDKEGLSALKQRALANPLYLKNVISEDAKTTALVIELKDKPGAPDTYKKETIVSIRNILKENSPPQKKYHMSGPTAIEFYLAAYMQEDLKTFLPIIFVIIVLVLLFSFRGFIGLMLPFSVVILSLTWTMALLYLCGYSINNVTTVIPPIMLSITLLESIHFVWELINRKKGDTKEDADVLLAETMQHLFVPCFLTNITTVIGFFSLLVTTVPPIRQLGWVAGIGVFFAFILTFTFLPALIKQFGLLKFLSYQRIQTRLKARFDRILMAFTGFSEKFRMQIIVVASIISLVAVIGTMKIKTETSVLEYFRKDSQIYQATSFIEKNLSGVHFLNVSLKSDQSDYFKDPALLERIERLQDFLQNIPEIDKVISLVDYLKEINKSFHAEDAGFYRLPDSRELVSQYALMYGANDLYDYVNSDWSWVTLKVRLKEHSTAKLKKVIANIKAYLNANFDSMLNPKAVGQTILEVDSNEAVTSGQIQSLSLALLLIFGMMFIDFRSSTLGLLSILPNVFPLLLNFGIMGFLAIRLDSATAMISDIGIGIIVDDTIHFFHSFAEFVRKTGDYRNSLYQSFAIKGSPTIITSIILILGFGVAASSRFVPTYYFGLLSAILIFNGLVSELLLSPALLMLFKPKFKK